MNSDTPWKADADVFIVTRPPQDLVRAMVEAAQDLTLSSADPGCRFYTHVREVEAPEGPGVVVTDVAEYTRTGVKKSAVVVSGLIAEGKTGQRTLTIRTHLEDQLTRYEGDVIVFDQHHDLIRARLVSAARSVDPELIHEQMPQQPTQPNKEASRESATPGWHGGRLGHLGDDENTLDVRSLAGMGLLGVGVVVLLVAVASGSWTLMVAALAFTALVGWAGSRIAGV